MRVILHLDLDAFFCAVEEQRQPALKGAPFAVGGRPDERGVVASCSYAARQKGVHSAMPMSQALRLCPGLKIVPARHGDYAQVSQRVMQHLHALTPLVEQISIDEAFLDVSLLCVSETASVPDAESAPMAELSLPAESSPPAAPPPTPEALARRLQAEINHDLGLPCSLGVASNKLIAKIANDFGKRTARSAAPPNAITVISPGEEANFLAPLSVDCLWGVGPKTAARLGELGITTIGELAGYAEAELVRRFGKNGYDLHRHARGQDDSPIVTEHEPRSVSQETTFNRDVHSAEVLLRTLDELAAETGKRLRETGYEANTVKIKLRWSDFTTITRQATLPAPSDADGPIITAARRLFERAWPPGRAVRLIGVGVSGLRPPVHQLSFFDQSLPDEHTDGSEPNVSKDDKQ